MTKKERALSAVELLKNEYPEAVCSLTSSNPFELLVAVRLSAQCTDARVNIVCRELFERFPDAAAMADGDIAEIEEIVKPCGLFRGKAASIKESSKIITEKYGGAIPDAMDELLSLPGVGRKIANLVLGDVYGRGGIVADTHCMRICGRLGFYDEDARDPLFTERVMDGYIERSEQSEFCHRIVNFGRDVCTARSPSCASCPLRDSCDGADKNG